MQALLLSGCRGLEQRFALFFCPLMAVAPRHSFYKPGGATAHVGCHTEKGQKLRTVYTCSAMVPQHPREQLPWRSRGLNPDGAPEGGCSPAGLGLLGRLQPLTETGAREMGALPAGGVCWGRVCVGAAQRSCRTSAGCTASGMPKRRLGVL